MAPESRPLVAAIHIASGLIEEMTEAGAGRPPTGSNVDSSARIDVSFLREAGLEEVFKKSRVEAEKLLGGVAERTLSWLASASLKESVDADCHGLRRSYCP